MARTVAAITLPAPPSHNKPDIGGRAFRPHMPHRPAAEWRSRPTEPAALPHHGYVQRIETRAARAADGFIETERPLDAGLNGAGGVGIRHMASGQVTVNPKRSGIASQLESIQLKYQPGHSDQHGKEDSMFSQYFAKFRKTGQAERTLDFYFDKKVGAYGIGDLPDNLKLEVASLIDARTPGKKFDTEYIRSLDLSEEASRLFSLTLYSFFTCAEHLVGGKTSQTSSAFKGWRIGLYFVPSADVNALVKLSADEKANTVFILLNAGLILALLHRFCALFSVPGFFESMSAADHQTMNPIRHSPGAQMPQREGAWLAVLPASPRQIAIAHLCTIMAAITVLCHEFGHFVGGHLSYLRQRHRNASGLEEISSKVNNDALPDSLRRLLELDADRLAGAFASVLWRELDYPWIGPEDAQVESFYLEFVLSAICLYIVFEECSATTDYFSPAWRVEHFLTEFRGDFFHQADNGSASPEKRDPGQETFAFDNKIRHAVEQAYVALGWGNGFSYQRIETETTTLFNGDILALASLKEELVPFMPHVWQFKR